jgi:hypothetical protein
MADGAGSATQIPPTPATPPPAQQTGAPAKVPPAVSTPASQAKPPVQKPKISRGNAANFENIVQADIDQLNQIQTQKEKMWEIAASFHMIQKIRDNQKIDTGMILELDKIYANVNNIDASFNQKVMEKLERNPTNDELIRDENRIEKRIYEDQDIIESQFKEDFKNELQRRFKAGGKDADV